jgi:hypothetical protein
MESSDDSEIAVDRYLKRLIGCNPITNRSGTGLALILAALFWAVAPLQAQTAPRNNVADRYRQQTAPATEREHTEALLTGDTDLVLLRRTSLFTLSGTLGASPTSNAFLSTALERSDIILQAQAGLRVGTRLGGRVDVFAEAGLLGVRYARFDTLGYNAVTGAIGAATQVDGFDLALLYQPSIIYSRDFRARQLTQHQFTFSISRSFDVGSFLLTPSVLGQRVESSPSDYRNWAASADLSLSRAFRIGRLPAALFATGGFEYRAYDSYFRDLLGGDRSDKLLRASAGLVVQIAPAASLRAAYTFQHNRSTSDVNGYTAHSGGLSLSAGIRF